VRVGKGVGVLVVGGGGGGGKGGILITM